MRRRKAAATKGKSIQLANFSPSRRNELLWVGKLHEEDKARMMDLLESARRDVVLFVWESQDGDRLRLSALEDQQSSQGEALKRTTKRKGKTTNDYFTQIPTNYKEQDCRETLG